MAKDRHSRIDLFPRLQAGQTLEYQVSYHSERKIKTETPAFAPAPANTGNVDITALIRLNVLGVQPLGQRAVIQARTSFRLLDTHVGQKIPGFEGPNQVQREESGRKFVDFTILPDGRINKLAGLDQLTPDQQEAWQEWLARFLLTATLPADGLRLQQKWTSKEPESSPSPISGLRWVRESTYADNQTCRLVEVSAPGQIAVSPTEVQMCAVILTTAALKQLSKQSDATPEDFRVRELRTTGTVNGTNHIVTYVSLKTGLLVRANEESVQQMDVTIAKTDGSNRVRYAVKATNRSEVVLVKQTAISP